MQTQTTASASGRTVIACRSCRERKVKCSGGQPCAKCAVDGNECTYPSPQRRRGKRNSQAAGLELENRLARMERMLMRQQQHDAHNSGGLRSSSDALQAAQSPLDIARSPVSDRFLGASGSTGEFVSAAETLNRGQPDPSLSHSTASAIARPHFSHDTFPSPEQSQPRDETARNQTSGTTSRDEEENVIPLKSDNYWEHHGPGAWTAVCSEQGLKWVCARTGSIDFIDSAKGLVRNWTQRLRFKHDRKGYVRAPEPDEMTAWRYCTAYFDESYEAGFGIVHRPSFENLLKAHLENGIGTDEAEDACAYALRHIVYATGCRNILAKDPTVPFTDTQCQAWRYFENALSVLRDLIFYQTGLCGVQALGLMALYVFGLGSPNLEYMLSSLAARAAQAKGLHRQPSKSWGLPDAESLHRSWLFWAIYSFDKQVAFMSGRPSVIDDDNISCRLPSRAPSGSTADVEIFSAIVRLTQLSSQISKRIMSVKAFQQSSADFIASVKDIDMQLHRFRDSLPVQWRPGAYIGAAAQANPTPRLTQILHVHFVYYGNLIATHILLMYPWMPRQFSADPGSQLREQRESSSITAADAARNIIKNTRAVVIDAATPQFLAFYYPVLSHITLFIHVLMYTNSSSACSDVALLDACAGHFSYMQWATSVEIAFLFARKSADLARGTVERARELNSGKTAIDYQNINRPIANNGLATSAPGNETDTSNSLVMEMTEMSDSLWDEILGFDSVDFDLESRKLLGLDGDAFNGYGLNFTQIL